MENFDFLSEIPISDFAINSENGFQLRTIHPQGGFQLRKIQIRISWIFFTVSFGNPINGMYFFVFVFATNNVCSCKIAVLESSFLGQLSKEER